MNFTRIFLLSAVLSTAALPVAAEQRLSFTPNQHFLSPPTGMATIGDAHGDIAVAPNGDVYVSIQGGDRPGLQVYNAQGRYLRNLPNAPSDLHGFIITRGPDGGPSLFGASLGGQEVVQLALDGRRLLTIPASSIPDQYKTARNKEFMTALTGVAVAPNGDIYAVDGYGRDFIHRFDRKGRYLGTFGGRGEPWNFSTCHKIAIDSRFQPARLLCADRSHGRVVQMNLDGEVLAVVATELRAPSALAVFGNELAVGELGGRVVILGLNGELLASIGANEEASQIQTNTVSPEQWKPELFYAPHGVAYDEEGNLLVTEWNKWGRVVRLSRH